MGKPVFDKILGKVKWQDFTENDIRQIVKEESLSPSKSIVPVETIEGLNQIENPSKEVIYMVESPKSLYKYNGTSFETCTDEPDGDVVYTTDLDDIATIVLPNASVWNVLQAHTEPTTYTISVGAFKSGHSTGSWQANMVVKYSNLGLTYQQAFNRLSASSDENPIILYNVPQDVYEAMEEMHNLTEVIANTGNSTFENYKLTIDQTGKRTIIGRKGWADILNGEWNWRLYAYEKHTHLIEDIVGGIGEPTLSELLKDIKENSSDQDVTHAELVALRDNGELVPGQRYRITDYTCTTKQPETHSAGHVFDIIVTADDVSTLNENARAVKHTGDTYFRGSKLSTWKLKYCLDNDITRFAWADTESGKGVIYYLEDEFGNLAEYDFKNIQFKRFRATIKKEYEEKLGDSKFMLLQDNGEGWYDINDSVFELDTDDYIWCYTFHDIVNGNKDGSLNHFDGEVYNPRGVFKNSISCNRISVSYDEVLYTSLYLSNIVHYVTLPTGDDYDTEGYWTCGNEFGIECQNLTFSKKCKNSKFIGSIRNTTFGGNIGYSTFGGYIWDTTFGGYINGATFGGDIWDTTFGGNIENTTFGGGIYYATFGGYIGNTTFGGDIGNTTFGGYINRVTFGGYIDSATFGGNIYEATFGGYIERATFGGDIGNTTFGGYIGNTTFGGNLYNGHIHGRLYSVSIGSAGETWSNLVIDPGVEYVSVTCTESGDADIKNVHIFSGVSGTYDNPITVSIPTRNNALLEIKPTTKTEILV